jgi:hypothetical protein
MRGYLTLDALLMAQLATGDVSNLLKIDAQLYYASAAFLVDPYEEKQKASFVASLRPEHHPELRELIAPNTHTPNAPPLLHTHRVRGKVNDVAIGRARRSEAGNILNQYTAHPAAAIEWYATGHPEQVLRVVKDIAFIGKRRSAGYGEIGTWQVIAGTLDGLTDDFGEPLRPVPVERWPNSTALIPSEAAWCAPYWDIRNRTKCYTPEAR